MDIKAFAKDNKLTIAATVAVVAVLGGQMRISLPADKKVAELEVQIAQTWQQREAWQQKQSAYHNQREIEDIQFRLKYIRNEINRINNIPKYLNRPLTTEEQWTISELREDWTLLKQRLEQLKR